MSIFPRARSRVCCPWRDRRFTYRRALYLVRSYVVVPRRRWQCRVWMSTAATQRLRARCAGCNDPISRLGQLVLLCVWVAVAHVVVVAASLQGNRGRLRAFGPCESASRSWGRSLLVPCSTKGGQFKKQPHSPATKLSHCNCYRLFATIALARFGSALQQQRSATVLKRCDDARMRVSGRDPPRYQAVARTMHTISPHTQGTPTPNSIPEKALAHAPATHRINVLCVSRES